MYFCEGSPAGKERIGGDWTSSGEIESVPCSSIITSRNHGGLKLTSSLEVLASGDNATMHRNAQLLRLIFGNGSQSSIHAGVGGHCGVSVDLEIQSKLNDRRTRRWGTSSRMFDAFVDILLVAYDGAAKITAKFRQARQR